MKRLLIAAFLVIITTTVLSIAYKKADNPVCRQKKICCLKQKPAHSGNEEYIFWEPMSRILMIR